MPDLVAGGSTLTDILPGVTGGPAAAPAASPMAGSDIVGQIPAMVQRMRQATPEVGAAMGEIDANGKRIADVNKRLAAESATVKDLKTPDLVDMPKETPQEYRSSFEAFNNAVPVLAIFGSMLTRAPLTSAINAAASAMEGFHQGDKEAVKLHEQNWRNATETALAQNKKELESYRAILEKHNLSVSDMIAELNGAASASNNTSLKASLANGQLSAAVQIIQAQESARARLQTALDAHLDRQQAEAGRAEGRRFAHEDRQAAIGVRSEKTAAAKEAAVKKNDEMLAQADDLLAMIKADPDIVGTRGKIKGTWNTIKGLIDPTADVDDHHVKFQSALEAFRNEASVALSGSRYYSKPRMLAMAGMLPGLDKFTSAQDATAGLVAIKNILEGARNEFGEVSADTGGVEAPGVGTILDGHRFLGGDPTEESSWELAQ
jgi:hypothetical protein